MAHEFLFGFRVGLYEVLPTFRIADVLLRVIQVEPFKLILEIKMKSFAVSQLFVDLLVFLLEKG